MTDSPEPKILVATDFSINASLALDHATELARAKGVPILLVHSTTVESVRSTTNSLPDLPVDFEDSVRRACAEGLEKLAESTRADGVEVETRLLSGPPAEAVAALAEQESPLLVVVGARGSTGFAHLLLGRIAEEIVRLASCPVLTVHPSDAEGMDAIQQVLIASDLSPMSELATETAIEVLGERAKDVEIVLLHAVDIPMVLVPVVALSVTPSSLREELAEKAQKQLGEQATKLRDRGYQVRVETGMGDAAEVIVNTAGREAIDLIVMGKRGAGKLQELLIGSVAQRVVKHAPCPVLTISEGSTPAT